MLLFGHIGITAGIVRASEILGSVGRKRDSYKPGAGSAGNTAIRKVGWQDSIDYRFVLLGSLLPDIVDKPLWFFASSDLFRSGRDYAHTLLFNLVLFLGGLILLKYGRSWLLIMSSCSFMHLILDQMWGNPVILWWPLLGPFQRAETSSDWLANMIHALFSDASVYIPEMIGLVIVLLLSYRLIVSRNVRNLVRTGAIG